MDYVGYTKVLKKNIKNILFDLQLLIPKVLRKQNLTREL